MILNYKYRLYPNKSQEQKLIQMGGNTRWLWNYFHNLETKQYKENQTFLWFYDLAMLLPELKEQYSWLKEYSYSQSLQSVARHMDQALKNLKRNNGFPKSKKKYDLTDSIVFPQDVTLQGTKRVRIPKVGDVKLTLHRELPKYKTVTIKRDGNKWFITFTVEVKEKLIQKPTNHIGIDLNSDFFVTSEGEMIKNPKFKKQVEDTLKDLQRKLAKTQKNSTNRSKLRMKLRRLHQVVRNKRKNFLDQISNQKANDYGLVITETLDIEAMKRSHPEAIAIADAGWRILIDMLKYKCELYGSYFIQIDQWLPTTQRCFCCGKINKVARDQRTYHCSFCGYTVHRDLNAALNIEMYGLQEFFRNINITSGTEGSNASEANVLSDLEITPNIQDTDASKEEAVTSLDQQ